MVTPRFVNRINALFSIKIHNKLGAYASAILVISLFLPIANIEFLGFRCPSAIIERTIGKAVFFITVITFIMYYGGATMLYTRIMSFLIISFILFMHYGLFAFPNNSLSFNTFFKTLTNYYDWGAIINFFGCVLLLCAMVKKGYGRNMYAI